jgi:hypothetical protein
VRRLLCCCIPHLHAVAVPPPSISAKKNKERKEARIEKKREE